MLSQTERGQAGLNWPSGATVCLAVQPDMLPKWEKCEMVMLCFCSVKYVHSVWVSRRIVCFYLWSMLQSCFLTAGHSRDSSVKICCLSVEAF